MRNGLVYAKRDDEIGPGLGGNKTRKLEYLLADAQNKKARKMVTFGGLQSNHARLTAAAANRLGLETHLFYFERRPEQLQGNLLVNKLLGAQMHFFPLGGGGADEPGNHHPAGALGRLAASGSALLHPGWRPQLVGLHGLCARRPRNR